MQQKWDQEPLGTQKSSLIGSKTRLGPSMDPAMAKQYTKHGPLYIGYIFALYATKKGQFELFEFGKKMIFDDPPPTQPKFGKI